MARCIGAFGAIFLTDDSVARAFGVQNAAHRGFGGAIGLGYRGRIGLGFMGEGGAEQRADRRAGGVGEAVGEGDIVSAHRSSGRS